MTRSLDESVCADEEFTKVPQFLKFFPSFSDETDRMALFSRPSPSNPPQSCPHWSTRAICHLLTLCIGAAQLTGVGIVLEARANEELPSVRVDSSCLMPMVDLLLKKGGVTAQRAEQKYVTYNAPAENILKFLREKFPNDLRLRDVPSPGKANVTSTDYTQVLQYQVDVPGKQGGTPTFKKAKPRIREYGERPIGSKDDPTKSKFYQEHSKFELKIDHPDHENVVVKATVPMRNEDIELLLNRETFAKFKSAIAERTKGIVDERGRRVNAGQEDVIDELIRTMERVHETFAKKKNLKKFPEGLKRVHNTEYERTSYIVDMLDRSSGEKIKIDVTFDQNVELYLKSNPAEVSRYPDDARVTEAKIPLKYALMSPEELIKVSPELQEFRRLLAQAPLIEGYKANSGKLSNLVRGLPQSNRGFVRRQFDATTSFIKSMVERDFMRERLRREIWNLTFNGIMTGAFIWAFNRNSEADELRRLILEDQLGAYRFWSANRELITRSHDQLEKFQNAFVAGDKPSTTSETARKHWEDSFPALLQISQGLAGLRSELNDDMSPESADALRARQASLKLLRHSRDQEREQIQEGPDAAAELERIEDDYAYTVATEVIQELFLGMGARAGTTAGLSPELKSALDGVQDWRAFNRHLSRNLSDSLRQTERAMERLEENARELRKKGSVSIYP